MADKFFGWIEFLSKRFFASTNNLAEAARGSSIKMESINAPDLWMATEQTAVDDSVLRIKGIAKSTSPPAALQNPKKVSNF